MITFFIKKTNSTQIKQQIKIKVTLSCQESNNAKSYLAQCMLIAVPKQKKNPLQVKYFSTFFSNHENLNPALE
jgi:hypothetical protein